MILVISTFGVVIAYWLRTILLALLIQGFASDDGRSLKRPQDLGIVKCPVKWRT